VIAIARALAAVVLLAPASEAQAHPVFQGLPGFYGGLLHPLFVPVHLMAIAALGLLVGQQAPRWGRGAPIVYVVGLVVGLRAIALAYVPVLTEEALLVLAAGAGLLLALARPLPQVMGLLLAAAAGLAVALDSPPDAVSIAEANITLLGTGFGATVLLLAAAEVSARLTLHWQRIAARILGSWIAASAILVLALRLAR
jgi:urease accessory protein